MAQQHLRLNDSDIDAASLVPALLWIDAIDSLFTSFQTSLSTRSTGASVLMARFDSKAAPSPALAPTTFWTRAVSRPPHEADPSHSPFDIGHWRWPMRKSGFTGGSTGRAGPEGGRSQGGDGAALESNRAVKNCAPVDRLGSGVCNGVKSESPASIHRRAGTGGAASMPLSFKRRCCCAIVVGGRPRLA